MIELTTKLDDNVHLGGVAVRVSDSQSGDLSSIPKSRRTFEGSDAPWLNAIPDTVLVLLRANQHPTTAGEETDRNVVCELTLKTRTKVRQIIPSVERRCTRKP